MTEDGQDQRDPSHPGRRDYDQLAKKVDDYIERTEKRIRKFFIGALIAFSIIGLSTSVALVGFGFLLHERAKQARDIQQQRADSIRANCKEQNKRNKVTSDSLISAAKVDEDNQTTTVAKVEIRRRRDVTLALINALAPHADCEAAVRKAVQK